MSRAAPSTGVHPGASGETSGNASGDASGVANAAARSAPARVRAPRWQPWLALALLLAVLTLAAVLVTSQWPRRAGTSGGAGAVDTAEALALTLDRTLARGGRPLPPGLAVRPLSAPEGDGEAAAIGATMCEAIGTRLARLPQLRVTPCSSTRAAVAARLDDAALARLVVAQWVLRGEIASRPAGRVALRLALHEPAARAAPVWQMDEEVEVGQLQALPQRLAQAASVALGRPAPGPDAPAIAAALYVRYLRAVQLARVPDAASRQQALAIVDEVLAAEPGYGPALYVRLALRILGAGAPAGPPSERRAHEEAITAELESLGARLLRADPANVRAHVLLLSHAFKQRRWVDMFAHADAMLPHAPQVPFVLRIAARVHLYAGYVRRAGELALQAVQLDALDADSMEALALVHGVLGDDARMAEFAALARQLGHRGTGLQEMVLARRRGDAVAAARAAHDWAAYTGHPAGWVEPFARALADARARPAARAAFDGMGDAARFGMADYFVERGLVGDHAGSLRALQQQAREAPARWVEQLWWPELAPVRGDAAFTAIVEALNLPPLWAQRGAPDLCSRQQDRWTCR
ncbi:MAG: hypothetical protein KIT17_12545 [Rubrivivax sp.]|nr:hypothetical protein [Rubrivivax sp.]